MSKKRGRPKTTLNTAHLSMKLHENDFKDFIQLGQRLGMGRGETLRYLLNIQRQYSNLMERLSVPKIKDGDKPNHVQLHLTLSTGDWRRFSALYKTQRSWPWRTNEQRFKAILSMAESSNRGQTPSSTERMVLQQQAAVQRPINRRSVSSTTVFDFDDEKSDDGQDRAEMRMQVASAIRMLTPRKATPSQSRGAAKSSMAKWTMSQRSRFWTDKTRALSSTWRSRFQAEGMERPREEEQDSVMGDNNTCYGSELIQDSFDSIQEDVHHPLNSTTLHEAADQQRPSSEDSSCLPEQASSCNLEPMEPEIPRLIKDSLELLAADIFPSDDSLCLQEQASSCNLEPMESKDTSHQCIAPNMDSLEPIVPLLHPTLIAADVVLPSLKTQPNLADRFHEFFTLHEWHNKDDEYKLSMLLDLAETHPGLVAPSLHAATCTMCGRGTRNAKCPSKLASRKDRSSGNRGALVDDDVDSDGTWDEEFNPPESKKPKTIDSAGLLVVDPLLEAKEKGAVRLPLLTPNYYTKFSEQARTTVPRGSRRSLAALANTRKHIVERRQLKALLDQCVCTFGQCKSPIDIRCMKFREISFTIVITSQCTNPQQPHRFTWSSSEVVRHKTRIQSQFYALNIAVQSAIQLSGNNWHKIKLFFKFLNVHMDAKAYDKFMRIFRPVIGKCFDTTRRLMLETLSNSTSPDARLVLAGDGQFDSPGSSATMCTYTLMALGVEEAPEKQDGVNDEEHRGSAALKNCGYILNQAVIDRRHAGDCSVNMERVGLHWAMRPIIDAGLDVSELVTDDHVQIVSDFKKIKAAAEERTSNLEHNRDEHEAMEAFEKTLSTALLHIQPPVNVGEDGDRLLDFYQRIVHSNDIWHRAKNLLKTISAIAEKASAKEQATYRRYAKMLRNFLWECAERSAGDSRKFVEMWVTIGEHIQDDHTHCDSIELHSKTERMEPLDQSTRSFDCLMKAMRRVELSAPQLCRFRNTGILESYNGLCLKYCTKRIFLPYDSMVARRELCALDHNHHITRSYATRNDGRARVQSVWRKSTKSYALHFIKEEKTYDYIPHLMAALLYERYSTEMNIRDGPPTHLDSNPIHIRSSLVPRDERESLEATCSKWLARRGNGTGLKRSAVTKAQSNKTALQVATRKKKRKISGQRFEESESSAGTSDDEFVLSDEEHND